MPLSHNGRGICLLFWCEDIREVFFGSDGWYWAVLIVFRVARDYVVSIDP